MLNNYGGSYTSIFHLREPFDDKYSETEDHDKTRVDTLRPKQNGQHFADDIFQCIYLNENVFIPNIISLQFIPKAICRHWLGNNS